MIAILNSELQNIIDILINNKPIYCFLLHQYIYIIYKDIAYQLNIINCEYKKLSYKDAITFATEAKLLNISILDNYIIKLLDWVCAKVFIQYIGNKENTLFRYKIREEIKEIISRLSNNIFISENHLIYNIELNDIYWDRRIIQIEIIGVELNNIKKPMYYYPIYINF